MGVKEFARLVQTSQPSHFGCFQSREHVAWIAGKQIIMSTAQGMEMNKFSQAIYSSLRKPGVNEEALDILFSGGGRGIATEGCGE